MAGKKGGKGSARCPMCGSEIGQSPVGQAVNQAVAARMAQLGSMRPGPPMQPGMPGMMQRPQGGRQAPPMLRGPMRGR
jgi:hypothetical protein